MPERPENNHENADPNATITDRDIGIVLHASFCMKGSSRVHRIALRIGVDLFAKLPFQTVKLYLYVCMEHPRCLRASFIL